MEKGNKKVLMCPFHGWCYDTKGTLLDCGNNEKAGYSDDFSVESLNLKSIGRIESYRGFVFGSLSEDVCSLSDFLVESKHLIDMLVEQSDEGLEVLPGTTKYTYDGNWKLQAENGVDGYHVESIHANYVLTVQNRKKILAENDVVKSAGLDKLKSLPGGYYDLGQGHVLLWQEFPNMQDRPLAEKFDELKEKYGELRAKWMAGYLRNLCLYPNVFIMDQMSSQIRHFRPIAVDKTEVTTFCIAPVGESDEARNRRIRQYEDFFNATGMATPDDLTAFNNSQIGFMGERSRWSDMSRGTKNIVQGPENFAQELGINPVSSGINLEDEGLMIAQHKHWSDIMTKMQDKEAQDAS
jgi:benzoate/toluate 1,2-dioxygenase alpha subunit